METNRKKLYEQGEDFFTYNGSAVMQLTAIAAVQVCREASARKIIVLGVEGGWHEDGRFAPDGECLWDGDDTINTEGHIYENNHHAELFIKSSADRSIDAFIITVIVVKTQEK